MCQRFALSLPSDAVRGYFDHVNEEPYPPRYNIAPTQPIAVVINDFKHQRMLELVRWGLIPSWVKDPAGFSTIVNARSETITVKPSFRSAIRHRRCLVPASGFYEWTGPRGAKQPHLISAKDHGPLAFAGICEDWLGADGSELRTAAIVTVPANTQMRPIHDRMPLILKPRQFATWLDCRSGSSAEISPMLATPVDLKLEIIQVSKTLNNWRNDGPQVQDPWPQTLL